MAKPILLEELHLTFLTSGRWSDRQCSHALGVLRSQVFRHHVRQAIQAVIAQHSHLDGIRWRLQR